MGDSNQVSMDDIMLTMDVVDTLRRRQALVDHELDSEAREQALIEKVRSIYAAQGIEVDDKTIAAGVEALKDQRFAYHPPPSGLMTRLWHLYVDRGRWSKRIGMGLAALLAAWGIHYGTVTLPEKRAAKAELEQLNRTITHATLTTAESSERLQRLRRQLQAQPTPSDQALRTTAQTTRNEADRLLNKAAQLIESARTLGKPTPLPADAATAEKEKAKQKIATQQKLLGDAGKLLDSAEKRIGLLANLDHLPANLRQYKQAIDELAKERKARKIAAQLYDDSVTALRKGDIQTARIGLSDLKDLLTQLQQAYTLRIVSRPGERSGVWRVPDVNSRARNHYLIVEAIDKKGRRLKLPVTSEEDGKTREVRQWGLRVDAATYQRVAADKKDDGIIQKNIVGEKRAGYLKPDYRIETTGGAITQW